MLLRKDKKLLSIIIPTRRDPSRIIDHLNAVFQSNTTLIELIVVYDCILTDAALKGKSPRDPLKQKIQIKVHSTKAESGIGPGGARNLGIRFATGEYVTFVDDDDEISINYQKLIELLNTSSENLIIGEFSHTNECFSRNNTTSEKKITVRDYINRLNSQKKILNHCTGILINRSFLIKNSIKFLETRLVEDLVFTTRLLSLEKDIYITNFFRYEYKLQNQTTKNLINEETLSCIIKAINELIYLKKYISEKYMINYLEEKIHFLKFLLKARAPLLLQGKNQKNSSVFEIAAKLQKILFDKNNITRSAKMIWLGLMLTLNTRKSILKINKKIKKENLVLVLYCYGALSKIWKNLFINLGYNRIYIVDDIFNDDKYVFNIEKISKIVDKESKRNHYHFIITNLHEQTVKKIEKKIIELLKNSDTKFEISSLEKIIDSK